MSAPRSRSWTDARDGGRWEIVFDPGVALDAPKERNIRERIVFRGDERSFHAPAVYGSDLASLSDDDLQGLLDQARAEQDDTGSAWR